MKKILILVLLLIGCSQSTSIVGDYQCIQEDFRLEISDKTMKIFDNEYEIEYEYQPLEEDTYKLIILDDPDTGNTRFKYDQDYDQVFLIDDIAGELTCPRK